MAFQANIKERLNDILEDYHLQAGIASSFMFSSNVVITKSVGWSIVESLRNSLGACDNLTDDQFVKFRTLLILTALLNVPLILISNSNYDELLFSGLGLISVYCICMRFLLQPCWLLDVLVLSEIIPFAILVLSAMAYYKTTSQKTETIDPPEPEVELFYKFKLD